LSSLYYFDDALYADT